MTAFQLSLASTHPGLQWKIVAQRILKANRRDLSCGFRERARGTANNVPVLSPSLSPPMEAIFPWLSTHLTWHQSGEMHWPHTDYSQMPSPTQLIHSSEVFQWLLVFLKILLRNSGKVLGVPEANREKLHCVALG